MTGRRHFVLFLSPGTLFDETTTREIGSWDAAAAVSMAEQVRERHGARPYGFQFVTKIVSGGVPDGEGGILKVEPKEVARSGVYYIGGKLVTVDDAPDGSILKSNMRGNDWPICCETKNGYSHMGVFGERDKIVGAGGSIVESGDDERYAVYRAQKMAEHEAEIDAFVASRKRTP